MAYLISIATQQTIGALPVSERVNMRAMTAQADRGPMLLELLSWMAGTWGHACM